MKAVRRINRILEFFCLSCFGVWSLVCREVRIFIVRHDVSCTFIYFFISYFFRKRSIEEVFVNVEIFVVVVLMKTDVLKSPEVLEYIFAI